MLTAPLSRFGHNIEVPGVTTLQTFPYTSVVVFYPEDIAAAPRSIAVFLRARLILILFRELSFQRLRPEVFKIEAAPYIIRPMLLE